MRLDVAFLRFLLNGLMSTGIHYGVLSALIEIGQISSAGLASGVASFFGMTSSYLGNRSFVFQSKRSIRKTVSRFLLLYTTIALLHVAVLLLWTDWAGLPYTPGFLIATAGAVLMTFFGNSRLVFSDEVTRGGERLKLTQSDGVER